MPLFYALSRKLSMRLRATFQRGPGPPRLKVAARAEEQPKLCEDFPGVFQGICPTDLPLEINHLFVSRHLIVYLSIIADPIHDLVLKRETFHLAHGIGVLQISALQGR